MNHSTPGLPVHHQLPEFTQTHVHRVGDPESRMNGYAEKAEVTTETSGSPSDDQLQSLLKAPYIPTRGFMLLLCSVPQL